MRILIDASVFIGVERQELDVDAVVAGLHGEDDCLISAITVSELLHGAHRAKSPGVRARRAAFVERILELFAVLPSDLPTARLHAQLWADLESLGAMINPHDLWLAAACIAHDHTLATGNVSELSQVPGLKLWPAR
ncbi:MAG TPA: PIN domain-containing protein [Planctomycetota bacterium]|nr:PIN domain-containing protein [Planctomycetota bacterium]HRR79443.1 PIN domain-containing protein [Planctomycetota bacterium]HRT95489.1 PIN domain-containing protein [Planctomycetota bacterium]